MNKIDLNTSSQFITHEGVISKISRNSVTVALKGNINCEGCKAKAACGVSESNDKEIEVYDTNSNLKLNEPVEVQMKKQLGLKAVFWAYFFPFLLLVSVLFIGSMFINEGLAGLLAILVLIPYYFILYVMKNYFKKAYSLSILKTS